MLANVISLDEYRKWRCKNFRGVPIKYFHPRDYKDHKSWMNHMKESHRLVVLHSEMQMLAEAARRKDASH